MEKNFSEGFLIDMADLMQMCVDNDTDTIQIEMEAGGGKVTIDITFSTD